MTYCITVLPSQAQFSANPEDNLLAAAKQQGLPLPHACQSGVCGSCKAVLVSGQTHALCEQVALSAEQIDGGEILLCCQAADSDVVINMPSYQGTQSSPAPILPARVDTVRLHGHYAVVELTLPKNRPFAFRAGQYVDVVLPANQRRSYSVAAYDETTHRLQLHVRHHPNGLFSAALFDGKIAAKSIVRLHGPLGQLDLSTDSARPLIILATGTGIAPVKAMLHTLSQQHSTREITVYWGMATEADFYDLDAIQTLIAALPHARLIPVLSRPHDSWTGARGHVQDVAFAAVGELRQHQLYACGNLAMVEDAQRRALSRGLPENDFFADHFTAAR